MNDTLLTEDRLREIIAEELAKVVIGSIDEVGGSVFDPNNVDASAIRSLQLTADTMNAMAVGHYEQGYANSQRSWNTGYKFLAPPPRLAMVVVIHDGLPLSYSLVPTEEPVTEERPQPWDVEVAPPTPIPDGHISIGRPINGMGSMYGFFDDGSNVLMGTLTNHQGIKLWFKPSGGILAAVWLPL